MKLKTGLDELNLRFSFQISYYVSKYKREIIYNYFYFSAGWQAVLVLEVTAEVSEKDD